MMADTFVNPALFRLRAFEVEWLEPLLNDLHGRAAEATLSREHMESDGTALLLYALVAEAYRWLTIGQQVGYFAQTNPSASPSSLADPPELERLLNAIRSQTELPPGLGIREFARALSEARDDLTAERREFLRLVYFAEEVEWFERLRQIRTLAEQFTARLEGFEIADEVAWGLDDFGWDISGDPIHPPAEPGETVSETSTTIELQRYLPAKWRLGSFALLAKQSPVAGRRLAALAEARASIAAAIQGLVQIQHTAPVSDELKHVNYITERLLKGKVVPVLGAGVNLWKQPPPVFERGRCLPSGPELADELARHLGNVQIDSRDLARVSQYFTELIGEGLLEEELHEVFNVDCPPTPLHHLLARLARGVRETNRECMLIVTTNYDNSLERAFTEEKEPYELVTYIARGPDRGLFRHITANGEATTIRTPNKYDKIQLNQRTVIAKIYGSVDSIHGDSFVITEDHYIDYLTRANLTGLFPVKLAAKLQRSHFLFLGYSLRDWNSRMMLYLLRGKEDKNFKSWAIQKNQDPIDRASWNKRGVEILTASVEDFVATFEQQLPAQQVVTR